MGRPFLIARVRWEGAGIKTLILNGSPRKNGDCAAMLTALREDLRGEIAEVRAYDPGISPCTDCRFCWRHDRCAIEDAMQNVYRMVEECDNVIIASPVHFSELSGSLLSLASRFQLYFAARFFRKDPVPIRRKVGVLVLSGGGDGSHEKAVSTATTLFHQINAEKIDSVFSLKTNDMSAKEDTIALAAAREAARMLNKRGENGTE